jgi:AAA domain-containing protein/bifunctional DNA primase/polymerase-like protein
MPYRGADNSTNASSSNRGNGYGGDPTRLRLQLLRNGYQPVPIIGPTVKTKSAGKRPPMNGWQDICATADEAEVIRWAPEYPDSTNTGIQCGRTVGADIDVRVPMVAKQIVAVARTMLGDTPLERVGMAPKTLLCYRADVTFRKIATSRLIMPDGSEAQIEILAEGQQFVAYGIHPDTLRPYEWIQDGPDTVPWTDLPVVTEAQLRAFVAAAEAILRAAGGRTKAEIEGRAEKAGAAPRSGAKVNDFGKAAGDSSFFEKVNRQALGAIETWFPKIFPAAELQSRTGAWRVRSEDLGRQYEEDLSMHPTKGGYDFGPEKSVSPIDVVMEHGGTADPVQAALWLCDQLRVDPADVGWKEKTAKKQKEKAGEGTDQQAGQTGANRCQPLLSLDDWLAAEIAPPDFVMGEVFHTESRAFLIGPTGLGKTNFSMALAAAMADGADFLHWKGSGKCRKVLYVDGEMGERLMAQRIQDVVRRHGGKPAGLTLLCRANLERRSGNMPPLNTKEGQQFIEAIIEQVGGVDFIVFDNLQALVSGSLREEDAFAAVLTWAKTLTSRSIGQIWAHHTGIDESRGYGDKSKEWQFDTVMILKRAGDDGEVLFDLEFPKARERAPDNRADFAPVRVELADDAWTVESTQKTATVKAPSPRAQAFHSALTDALCVSSETGVTTKEAWRSECRRKGLMHLDPGAAPPRYTKSSQAQFNQYVSELVTAKWVGVNGEAVRNTRK